MPSQTLRLSDSAITKALADQGVTELADPRYPLRLRVRTCRTKASWYLVLNQGNKTKWLKLGVWPSLTAKAVIAKLPTLLANHAAAESVNCDDWQTVGELLAWYQERAATDSSLSANRRINVKCSLSKHLIPRLQLIKLIGLTHEVIETALIWPLQSQYKLGTVRQHFALLKRVFKLAHKQKRLAYDPLASMTFSDFIDAKIPAKEAAIRFGQTHLIKQQIERECEPARTLALFMLMHGTRIGETRQLRWSYIDWHHAQVHLPASITKTATALSLPLTDHAIELLQ
ncbi:tyrosine-type recombinase/integrase, partial [Motilimonas cestriensis]